MAIYQIQTTQYVACYYDVEASSKKEALDLFMDGRARLAFQEIGDLACDESDIWVDEGCWNSATCQCCPK